jgi:hypothetical protein
MLPAEVGVPGRSSLPYFNGETPYIAWIQIFDWTAGGFSFTLEM